MLKKLLLLCIATAFFSIGAAAYEELPMSRIAPEKYMTSPYHAVTGIGDPFVMYDDASGKYYMYVTGGQYFKCLSSDTMKEWKSEGNSYVVSDKSFGVKNFWAPEVYKVGSDYYMVYSAMNEGGRYNIGLAKASNPQGPFTDVYDRPLFAPDYSVIDASLFFDDDGRVYLFFSKDCSENTVAGLKTSQSFGIELKKDLSATIGEPVLLSTPVFAWESKSGTTRWNEGPFVFKQNGIYYLLFSANYYGSEHYTVGYATAKSPLGPYEKAANNPLLVGDGVNTSGTGHCALTRSPDGSEIYISYHSHNNPLDLSKVNRIPCIDKLTVTESGELRLSGHTPTVQPL
ncbi:MAG: glycoside hydrolase family 43 protein, partial [Clostridia bacterium]|nr:glycoside hydrolase family 43 protein [Clostridia bacterium]